MENSFVHKCEQCNYNTLSIHRMESHKNTNRHKRAIGDLPPKKDLHVCTACNYSTPVKDRLRVHYLTLKHINAMQEPDHHSSNSEKDSESEKVHPEPEPEVELVETIIAKFKPIVKVKPKIKLSIKQ